MKEQSEFYPPRAAPWPIFFRRAWFAMPYWIKFFFSKFSLRDCSPWNGVLSVLLPAYVFKVFGFRKIALLLAFAYGIAFCAYIFWVGYFAFPLAVMISIHVSSVGYLCKRLTPDFSLAFRLLTSFALFAMLYSFIYKPINSQLGKMFMPLEAGNKIVIINRLASLSKIKRGEIIAYRINGASSGAHNAALAIHSGFGISPLLAVPGDTIHFLPKEIEVNGEKHPAQSYMPLQGEKVMTEKQWFVWPEVAIRGNRVASFDQISGTLQQCAVISEKEFVGKPFEHWFWKRQILP